MFRNTAATVAEEMDYIAAESADNAIIAQMTLDNLVAQYVVGQYDESLDLDIYEAWLALHGCDSNTCSVCVITPSVYIDSNNFDLRPTRESTAHFVAFVLSQGDNPHTTEW